MADKPRVTILMGATGSGKTELAVQFALDSAQSGAPTCLLDVDIVNPYFRSATQSMLLESRGVRVVKPNFALTAVDVPSLPPDISSALHGQERVVVDVGGDEVGATAMGRYHAEVGGDAEILFVVNVYRPMSETAEAVCALLTRLQACARLRVTGLVNNANLGALSTIRELMNGQAVLEDVARSTGIPLAYITGRDEVLAALPVELRPKAYPLRTRLRPEWM